MISLEELRRGVAARPELELYYIQETRYEGLKSVPTGRVLKGAPVWVQTEIHDEETKVVARYRVKQTAKVEEAQLAPEAPSAVTRMIIMDRLECL